jgi:hypothetical protein
MPVIVKSSLMVASSVPRSQFKRMKALDTSYMKTHTIKGIVIVIDLCIAILKEAVCMLRRRIPDTGQLVG